MTDQRPTDLRPDDEGWLRDVMHDAVADVEPEHGLDTIRARTRPHRQRRTRAWGAVAAVAAVAATVAAVTVLADRSPTQPDDSPAVAPTGDASAPPTRAPDDQQSDQAIPSPTGTPDAGAGALLPVYFVGDTPAGPRLYREFHHGTGNETTSAQMLTALDFSVRGDALDPDYRSAWPAGSDVTGAGLGTLATDTSAGAADDAILVALNGAAAVADRPQGMTEDQARMALQQLVYTAQAVLQQRLPVQFTGDNGVPLDRLLGIDVSRGVSNEAEMQVQAPVWIIDPQEGATVGSTFTVDGRGAFFEANVSWQLLQGDRVVKHGFTTAAQGMTLSPYSFTVRDVPSGDYTIRVYDADMSGEGHAEQQDTKDLTVH